MAEEVRPRVKKWMFVPIIGLLLLLAGCGAELSATKRFRIIATVEVDGQKVEGSTVIDIAYEKLDEKRSLIGRGGDATAKGEALILDLKERGTVYVLPYAHHLPSGEFPGNAGRPEGREGRRGSDPTDRGHSHGRHRQGFG